MKEKYIAPDCEIVLIGQTDVITTSAEIGDDMGNVNAKDMSGFQW